MHTIVGVTDDVDLVLSALADPTRRRMVEALGQGPLRSSELAERVGVAPTMMTRHLKHLRDTGLVQVASVPDDARVRLYTLRADPMAAVQAWIDQVSAQWSEQLGRFKAHAERRGK
jgi:DNA-binding transcriptional ArsR family regulator